MLTIESFTYRGEFPPPWWDDLPDWFMDFACFSVDTNGRISAWHLPAVTCSLTASS